MQKLNPELSRVSFSSFDDILSSLDSLDIKAKRSPASPGLKSKRANLSFVPENSPPLSPVSAPSSPSFAPSAPAFALSSPLKAPAPVSVNASTCGGCGQGIGNEKITADGKVWHPACFACHTCGKLLSGTFFPKSGAYYCIVCIEKQNPCTACKNPIPVGVKYSIDPQGNNFHTECWAKRKVCSRCEQPITEVEVKAIDKIFHPSCFTCIECNTVLEGTFVNVNGNPVCTVCRATSKPKCEQCKQPIMKTFTEFKGKMFHAGCFVCFKCKTEIGTDPFYDIGGKPVCAKCGAL